MGAQRSFANDGVPHPGLKKYVRAPRAGDIREPAWRPIDESLDNTEEPVRGMNFGSTYPEDGAALYYWRRSTN
jgi:hypothetical protein